MHDHELTREVPRLDPVPFIVADCILVAFAAFIGWQAPAPLGVAPLAAIAGLVALGAIAGLYPFVMNHTRRQEEALRERTAEIEALARTLGGAAEQVGIAVSSLPAIAENSARQLKLAEQLPSAFQAQIASLQQQLSATHAEENAALRHELDTLRHAQNDKLSTALADLARLEALAAKHAAAIDGAIAHLPRFAESLNQQTADTLRRETAAAVAALQSAAAVASRAFATASTEALSSLDRSVRDAVAHLSLQVAPTPPSPSLAITPAPIPAAPSTPALFIDEAGLDEPAPTPAPPPLPPAPVPPAAPSAPAPGLIEDATPEPEPAPEPHPDSPSDSPAAEPALSHDGYTRLIASAYIGIGNKLYIRGDGPGLRRDKGVPLQFVSIGKWRWESAELLFPAKVRLYKNDQIECSALGEITLEPGHHHELVARF